MRPAHCVLLSMLMLSAPAAAQLPRAVPFQITDNSLLVEEAFNQERGIFQNIVLFSRERPTGNWLLEFTQEWPLGGMRHQASFTVPFETDGWRLGNILVNYRLQLREEDERGPAISPRASILLPTADDRAYQGGAQVNLPVSKQVGDLYLHANAGLTYEWVRVPLSGLVGGRSVGLIAPHAAGSVIWRARPLVHVLVESVVRSAEAANVLCCGTVRETSWLVSPGVRAARNLGDHQVVLGAGLPLDLAGAGSAALLFYFSYELPFRADR